MLLPLVPAVLTYKLFPDQAVGAKGILSGLKINTTGAFAAYVIAVLLGYQPFAKTQSLIDRMVVPTWTVKAVVQLTGQNNEAIDNQALLETMIIKIDPKLSRVSGNNVILTIPGSEEQWAKTQIKFEVPNFGFTYIDLGKMSEVAEVNKNEMMLTIRDPIKIPLTVLQMDGLPMEEAFEEALQPAKVDLPPAGDL